MIIEKPLYLGGGNIIRLPLRFPGHPTFLRVLVRENLPHLLMLVTPGLPQLAHELAIYETEAELPDQVGVYVDTFELQVKVETIPATRKQLTRTKTLHLFAYAREVGKTKADER